MSDLKELIEENANHIVDGIFSCLTQRHFFQKLKLIDIDVWNTLIDAIDDAIRACGTAEVYLIGGGGTNAMDIAYDYCVRDISVKYIEKKMQEFEDEDEAEVIDYAEENPKTVREVM